MSEAHVEFLEYHAQYAPGQRAWMPRKTAMELQAKGVCRVIASNKKMAAHEPRRK